MQAFVGHLETRTQLQVTLDSKPYIRLWRNPAPTGWLGNLLMTCNEIQEGYTGHIERVVSPIDLLFMVLGLLCSSAGVMIFLVQRLPPVD